MFDSILPLNINWNEINCFLNENKALVKVILSDNWLDKEEFENNEISKVSLEVLKCLHYDLCNCYGRIFVRDEHGKEDRHEEYRLLRERLFLKYNGIQECILREIYNNYLMADK